MSRLADEQAEREAEDEADAHTNARKLRRLEAEALALEEIDDLPQPTRGRLALETILVVCQRGARAARGAKPEEALRTLEEHTRGMLPADPTTQTLDGWTRLGAVAGASDAWTRTQRGPPRDAPSLNHATLYGAAYAFAFGVVGGNR